MHGPLLLLLMELWILGMSAFAEGFSLLELLNADSTYPQESLDALGPLNRCSCFRERAPFAL